MAVLGLFLLLALAAVVLAGPDGRRRWECRARPPAARPLDPAAETGTIDDVPLLLELLGASCDAGLTIPGALRVVAEVAAVPIRAPLLQVVAGLDIGAAWDHAWDTAVTGGEVAQLRDALTFAAFTGAPAAPLLYAEAAQRRRQLQREAEKRAAALGVRLVVPLGLCSLPAFVCLGIVPVVIAMIPAL